jgi:hypothetical protein
VTDPESEQRTTAPPHPDRISHEKLPVMEPGLDRRETGDTLGLHQDDPRGKRPATSAEQIKGEAMGGSITQGNPCKEIRAGMGGADWRKMKEK